MGRLGLAFSTFFRVLGDAEYAQATRQLAEGNLRLEAKPGPETPKATKTDTLKPTRSDAITLLAALQRESRFVDFVQEDLSGYDDAQVGAAARDVHQGARQVLNRMFAIKPLRTEVEGDSVEVSEGDDAGCFQLVGKVEGKPPYRGSLNHHGWEAGQCEIPIWNGSEEASSVVAPAEIELS